MSDNIEAISVRTTRLNNLILGRSEATSKIPKQVATGLCRESLLVIIDWGMRIDDWIFNDFDFRILCVCCTMSVTETI